MRAAIRRVGNSAAILLPKPILSHLQVSAGDMLELDVEDGRVVLSPAVRKPREGWAEAARALSEAGEETHAWPEHDLADDRDWTW